MRPSSPTIAICEHITRKVEGQDQLGKVMSFVVKRGLWKARAGILNRKGHPHNVRVAFGTCKPRTILWFPGTPPRQQSNPRIATVFLP